MPFSWKALLLAPLLVPSLTGVGLSLASAGNYLGGFLFCFVLCGVLSYGATVCLLLPCLFLASCFTRLSAWRTTLLGLVLGLVVYFPVSWEMYVTSGIDSGPPSGTFAHYLWRNFWSDSWLFAASGMFTALLYWLLAKAKVKAPPSPAGIDGRLGWGRGR